MSKVSASRPRWVTSWLSSLLYAVAWTLLRALPIDSVTVATIVDFAGIAILCAAWLSFERGDGPRLGWGLLFAAQSLNAVGIAMRDQAWAAPWAEYWMHPYVLVNALLASGVLWFLINAQRSGLAPAWTTRAKVGVGATVVLAGTVALSLLSQVLETWGLATAPRTSADLGMFLMSGSSAIADAVVVVAAALIARIFLPMAPGRLARPYLLLSAAGFAYLVLDGLTVRFAGARMPDAWVDVAQWVYAAGEGALMAAALTQMEMLWLARWRERMLT